MRRSNRRPFARYTDRLGIELGQSEESYWQLRRREVRKGFGSQLAVRDESGTRGDPPLGAWHLAFHDHHSACLNNWKWNLSSIIRMMTFFSTGY